ncbi:restriction endonuclease subunit S [Candidatus Poriferisodalis sp.]|uniref:restriction endonuclease subunit S n=1 Tax=Candidatus Poriferisodalis sp. TaxID=3101277 RepID=UPI003B01949B
MKQAYANHRSSGIEWLGDIPAHWGLQRLGFALADAVAGGTPSTSRDDYWAEDDEDGMPWIAIADMSEGGIVESTEKAVTEPGMRDARLRPLPPGTIIYSMYASVGAVAVLGLEAVTNQAILGLLPRRHVENPYLFWWLHALHGPVLALTRNNTQANLSAETVRRLPIVLPPASEQQAISAFLDRETARIDRLITMQESLIERLDEYRTALITRVVTKGPPPEAAEAGGLDPEPALKDSGVEWLGEVPEHWVVKRLAYVVDCLDGKRVPLNSEQRSYRQGTIPYWGANGVLDHVDDWLFSEPLVLLGEDGAPFFTGNKRVAFSTRGKIWVNNHAHVLRPVGIHQEFLIHVLNVTDYAAFIGGSTRDKLTQGDMNDIPILVPPKEDQVLIIDYLSGQLDQVGGLRNRIDASIGRLREYRSALISAAVTGKIDVRDAALAGGDV